MINKGKSKIMHFYTYPENAGGPLTYIKTICESSLKNTYLFGVCYQNKPISKLRITDLKRMVNELKKFNPDVLHVHGLQGEGFIGVLVGKLARCRRILVTVHGLQQDELNISKKKRYIFKNWIEPFTLAKADVVYCVCKSTEEKEIIKRFSKKVYPYIHNPAPKVINSSASTGMRAELDLSEDDVVVVVVGRVSIDKGMDVLEKIIQQDNDKKVKYLIIGNGNYSQVMQQNLKAFIEKDKVIFLGQQSNVKKYLDISDIYLSVSQHENLSIAALEACISKLPCVLSNVGGNPEIIEDGYNGYIVTPNDHKETLKVVNRLASSKNERKRMGQNALEIANTKFSMEHFIFRMRKLYDYMIGKELLVRYEKD